MVMQKIGTIELQKNMPLTEVNELSEWDKYWLQFTSKETPSSTELHPDFLTSLHKDSLILDVGCGFGRTTNMLLDYGVVVGVDININELKEARLTKNAFGNPLFCQANGSALPFVEHQFDGAVLLGTLGATNEMSRERILDEAVRCIKPSGLLYASEFLLIHNDQRWDEIYLAGAVIAKEIGSFLPHARSGKQFIAHHFEQEEILTLFESRHVRNIHMKIVDVISNTAIANRYKTVCLWGEVC